MVGRGTEAAPEVGLIGHRPEVDRDPDVALIAAQVVAVPVQHRELGAEDVGGHEGHVPSVGPRRGDAQCAPLAPAADPQRHGCLQGGRQASGPSQRHVPALEGDLALVVEQGPQRLGRLVECVHPVAHAGEGDPEGLVFRSGPARTQPRLAAPVREMVDGGHGLGQNGHIAVPDAIHEVAAPDPLGYQSKSGMGRDGLVAAGNVRELSQRVRHRALGGHQMVPHRDPVEPGVLRPAPQRHQVRHRRVLKPRVDANPERRWLLGVAAHIVTDGNGSVAPDSIAPASDVPQGQRCTNDAEVDGGEDRMNCNHPRVRWNHGVTTTNTDTDLRAQEHQTIDTDLQAEEHQTIGLLADVTS